MRDQYGLEEEKIPKFQRTADLNTGGHKKRKDNFRQ